MEKIGMGEVVSKKVRHIRLELSQKSDGDHELSDATITAKGDKVARRSFGKKVRKLLTISRSESEIPGEVT